MNRKLILAVLTAVFLTACATSAIKEKTINLKIGMTQTQAKTIMQEEPCMTSAYLAGERKMESWIYKTGIGPCSETGDFLKLSFQDGKLIRWGKIY